MHAGSPGAAGHLQCSVPGGGPAPTAVLLPAQWLETGGYEAAPVQRVDCGFVYCSRQYEMPPGWAKEGVSDAIPVGGQGVWGR